MDSLNKLSEISNWRFSTNDTQRVFGFIVSFISHPIYAHSRHVVCLQKKCPAVVSTIAMVRHIWNTTSPKGLSGPLCTYVAPKTSFLKSTLLQFRPCFWKLNLVSRISRTQFLAKTDKIYNVTHFQTQTTQKPYPSNFGRHIYLLESALTPPPPEWPPCEALSPPWKVAAFRAQTTHHVRRKAEGPGGILGNSSWGCAAWLSKSWPYFRPKHRHFPHQFSDLASKIHRGFQT